MNLSHCGQHIRAGCYLGYLIKLKRSGRRALTSCSAPPAEQPAKYPIEESFIPLSYPAREQQPTPEARPLGPRRRCRGLGPVGRSVYLRVLSPMVLNHPFLREAFQAQLSRCGLGERADPPVPRGRYCVPSYPSRVRHWSPSLPGCRVGYAPR